MTAFTVRIADDVADKLDALADKLDRSRSYVAALAINDFIERESWQLAEIEAGVSEANQGDFASEAEITAVVGKYVKLSEP